MLLEAAAEVDEHLKSLSVHPALPASWRRSIEACFRLLLALCGALVFVDDAEVLPYHGNGVVRLLEICYRLVVFITWPPS